MLVQNSITRESDHLKVSWSCDFSNPSSALYKAHCSKLKIVLNEVLFIWTLLTSKLAIWLTSVGIQDRKGKKVSKWGNFHHFGPNFACFCLYNIGCLQTLVILPILTLLMFIWMENVKIEVCQFHPGLFSILNSVKGCQQVKTWWPFCALQ